MPMSRQMNTCGGFLCHAEAIKNIKQKTKQKETQTKVTLKKSERYVVESERIQQSGGKMSKHLGVKSTVMLYTYINPHAGTPDKNKTEHFVF